jgi:methanogenic corrinoid protein MtbC1
VAIWHLAQALGDLDDATVIESVAEDLAAGKAPLAIPEELQAGMDIVGERFEGVVQTKLGTLVLGTVFDDMKQGIQAIKDAGLREQVTVLIGGGLSIRPAQTTWAPTSTAAPLKTVWPWPRGFWG